MEILTKTGLDALWQKLKSSFILKKGGGTIVNNGDDSSGWKDYKLGINHTGFGLRDDQDRFRIRLSPDEVELKYKTNSEGTRITDNTISMPGIDLTGNKFSSTNYAGVKVSSYDNTKSTTITEEGIVTKNGTNKEVYTRDGDHVNIGDQPGNLVALDDNGKLPSAVGNFVPLDKASTIYVQNDNETKIDIGSNVTIRGKRKETNDYAYSNVYDYDAIIQKLIFRGVQTSTTVVQADHIGLRDIQYNNTQNHKENDISASQILMHSNADNSYIALTTDIQPLVHLYKYNTKQHMYLRPTGLWFELNGKKLGDLVGASGDFYNLNEAKGIPQLDANGKLDSSVLPSSIISDVQVNGTSVVSDGVANITPQNLLSKTFDVTIGDGYIGYDNNDIGLYSDKIASVYKSGNFNLKTVEIVNYPTSNSQVTSRISLMKYDISSSNISGKSTILLNGNSGRITCDGITTNSGDKDIYHVFNNVGGITYLSERFVHYKGAYESVQDEMWANRGIWQLNRCTPDGLESVYNFGVLLNLSSEDSKFQIYAPHAQAGTTNMYIRTGWDSSKNSWRRVLLEGDTISGSDTSDVRLKENIQDIDSLGVIDTLGGIHQFTYKTTGKKGIGLIAQNVRESELADIVKENDEGYLGIDYWSPKLVCLALGAAQQLDKRVKELEKQIEELKSK